MGLTTFACIPKQNDLHHFVRVVYPGGRIENLNRSCSVYELLRGNPDYFVCGCTANTITSRMGTHEHLEKGFTYFVIAQPNAKPIPDFHAKKTGQRSIGAGWRIPPRFARNGMQGREIRSSVHQRNAKVFDFHSAAIQVEGMPGGLHPIAPPKHLRLVFFRQCLQSLRLPVSFGEASSPSGDSSSPSPTPESSPSKEDVDLVNTLLKSEARSELGLYVSKRQEVFVRRSRRRRSRGLWKPVLQSISETTPVVEFLPPAPPQPTPEPESKRFSPPRPAKIISPPRQRASPRNISPPRQVHVKSTLARSASAPRQRHQRKPSNQRALYMA